MGEIREKMKRCDMRFVIMSGMRGVGFLLVFGKNGGKCGGLGGWYGR